MRNLKITTLLTIFVVSIINADYITFTFKCITNNNSTNAAIGENQFTVGVTDEGVGENQVMFVFTNEGFEESVISGIYFDDNPPELLSFDSFNEIVVIDNLQFEVGATPGNLPGGQAFSFTADNAYEPFNPQPDNGLNPGESLGIIFTCVSGVTFEDVIEALNIEDLVVGIHGIAFANGGSESFLMSIPEPSTLSLMLLGLFMIGAACLRKKR